MSTMRFSQRKGYKPVSQVIQTEGMSDELRNSIWNVLDVYVWKGILANYSETSDFSRTLWGSYFKRPIDTLPTYRPGGDIEWEEVLYGWPHCQDHETTKIRWN